MTVCGIPHPRCPEITCQMPYPHDGDWHKAVFETDDGNTITHEYRVRPPKPKAVSQPCLEDQ